MSNETIKEYVIIHTLSNTKKLTIPSQNNFKYVRKHAENTVNVY